MPLLKPGWMRRRWKLLLGGGVVVAYGLSGGCYAQQLPPSPSPEEAAVLRQGALPYAVIVAPWDSIAAARQHQDRQAYADATFRWLRHSGAFATVRLGNGQDSTADFLAFPTGAYCNTAVIPVFTILSLGLIPTIFTDTNCEGAVLHPLHPPTGRPDSVVLSSELSGRVIMGWLALPVGAFPGWTHGGPRDHTRYRNQVRLSILSHRSRLVALAGSP
jgi:hypothetical protein